MSGNALKVYLRVQARVLGDLDCLGVDLQAARDSILKKNVREARAIMGVLTTDIAALVADLDTLERIGGAS